MTVSAILKHKGTKVMTIAPSTTVTEALKMMTERNIGSAVVCDSAGGVVGILSERDIVRALSRNGPAAFESTVDGFMTDKVKTCAPDDTVKHVMTVMTIGKFRHLPVVVDGRLSGILSIGDVVKYRLDEAQLEIDVMRDQARVR